MPHSNSSVEKAHKDFNLTIKDFYLRTVSERLDIIDGLNTETQEQAASKEILTDIYKIGFIIRLKPEQYFYVTYASFSTNILNTFSVIKDLVDRDYARLQPEFVGLFNQLHGTDNQAMNQKFVHETTQSFLQQHRRFIVDEDFETCVRTILNSYHDIFNANVINQTQHMSFSQRLYHRVNFANLQSFACENRSEFNYFELDSLGMSWQDTAGRKIYFYPKVPIHLLRIPIITLHEIFFSLLYFMQSKEHINILFTIASYIMKALFLPLLALCAQMDKSLFYINNTVNHLLGDVNCLADLAISIVMLYATFTFISSITLLTSSTLVMSLSAAYIALQLYLGLEAFKEQLAQYNFNLTNYYCQEPLNEDLKRILSNYLYHADFIIRDQDPLKHRLLANQSYCYKFFRNKSSSYDYLNKGDIQYPNYALTNDPGFENTPPGNSPLNK